MHYETEPQTPLGSTTARSKRNPFPDLAASKQRLTMNSVTTPMTSHNAEGLMDLATPKQRLLLLSTSIRDKESWGTTQRECNTRCMATANHELSVTKELWWTTQTECNTRCMAPYPL
jgi:hypothetical protein